MPRPPLARSKILRAARQIVERSGAGALTFDELSSVSGLTRGGITYHFPTKDHLLRGLLEDDMAQWRASEEQSRPSDVADPELAELIGFIRSHTSKDDKQRRFVAGMISAAAHQPELLDSCRQEIARQRSGQTWDELGLKRHVLQLAAAGLFWEELFQLHPLPPEVRARLVQMMEQLAYEWPPGEREGPSSAGPEKKKHQSNTSKNKNKP